MNLILGVEGGGTRTRVGVYDEQGTLVAEAAGDPSNPVAYGAHRAARAIIDTSRILLATRPGASVRVYAALAGAAASETQQTIADAVGAALGATYVLVTSDLHALLHTNVAPGSGVLVIAGTGAAVLARNGRGQLLRRGGWGALLGDDGSGYALGVAGLRACARALDGVAPETALTELLPEAVGLRDFDACVPWTANATKRALAALAPVVLAAADGGDIVALSLIEEEARRLAALTVSAQEGLFLDRDCRLFLYGGLLENAPRFREAYLLALDAYTDMQVMACTVSGHAASYALTSLDTSPEWARTWQPASDAAPGLPVTEQSNPEVFLDALDTRALIQHMNRADAEAVAAVGDVLDDVARAVEGAAQSLRDGGRLVYAGAGTSGRLGALDAAECPPTFGVEPGRVVALMAGGPQALTRSVEGAEDSEEQGAMDVVSLKPSPRDMIIGIAASGATPYVAGALRAARQAGAATALVTSNPATPLSADIIIAPDTGPETLAGSTRLKAGTAAKLVLNAISTGAMTRAGYVYRGRMVGMIPANAKLRQRAARIVAEIAGVEEASAHELLTSADYHITTAIVMAVKQLSRDQAAALLEQSQGLVREALEGP